MIKAQINDGKLNLEVSGSHDTLFADLVCIIDGVSDTTGTKKYFLKKLIKGIKHISKHPLDNYPTPSFLEQ